MNLNTGSVAMSPIYVEEGVFCTAVAVPVPFPVPPLLFRGQKPHLTS